MGGSGTPTDATPIAPAAIVKTLQDRVNSFPTLNEGQTILQRLSRFETVRVPYKLWTPSSGETSPWVVVKMDGNTPPNMGIVKIFQTDSMTNSSVVGVLCKLVVRGNMVYMVDLDGNDTTGSVEIEIYKSATEVVAVTKDSQRFGISYTLFSPLLQQTTS